MQRSWIGVALAILYCAVLSHAQLSTGSISGTVSDQTGAVIPTARVTVTNTATGVARRALAGQNGTFLFSSLPPGTYTIEAVAVGFKVQVIEDVRLTVDQELRHDISMTLGAQAELVTVKAEAVAVGTEQPTLGTIISERQAAELPLNGRSFLQLAQISTGVASPGTAQGESTSTTYGRRSSVSISISGQREFTTDYRFDGIPSRDRVYGPVGMQFDVDAIAEFNIQRGYAAAETGVSGRINLVTKSGTNSIHGSAWEFLRNEKLDARNFFASRNLPLRRNQFGASVGGPILKNRLFYFGDYEGLRFSQSNATFGLVASQQMLGGNFAGLSPVTDPSTGAPFPGNIVPSNRISRFAQGYTKYIPMVNGSGPANIGAETPITQSDNKYNGRVDFSLSAKDTIFGRYTHVNSEALQGSFAPLGGTQTPLRARNAVIAWTHVFTPRLLNDFRAGLDRVLNFPYLPQGAESNPNFPGIFSLQNLIELKQCNGLPSVGMLGYASMGSSSLCIALTSNDYHFIDHLSYLTGKHSITAGVEITKVFMRQVVAVWGQGTFNFTGQFSGNAVADYLLGIPNTATGQAYARIPDRRATWWSPYVNDEIRVSRTLTLSLGLRYDYFQPLAENNHKLVSFDRSAPGGGFLYEPGSGLENIGRIGPPGLLNPDRNNFAPRVGVAWSPDRSLAVRSSYGIFYQEPAGNRLNTQQTGPPFVLTTSLTSDPNKPTLFMDGGGLFPAQSPPYRGAGLSSFGYDPNARTSYLQIWTFSLQKTLPGSIFAEAAYIGSKGTKLDKLDNINMAATPPPPGYTGTLQARLPFPDFGFVLYTENKGVSSYNSLQLTLRKNLSHGLTLLTNYTYAKSLDMDSFDNKACRCYIPGAPGKARSVFDQRNRFIASWVYDVPTFKSNNRASRLLLGGWQVNGITTLQSGFPFQPTTGRDYSNRLSVFINLPNRLCNGSLPPGERGPARWFDTSCFQVPAINTLGNSGFGILDTDGVINQDLGVFKTFRPSERFAVQFRSEFFNIFNHASFKAPVNQVESPLFGQVLSALDGRIIQFALKATW